jgi:Ca2+-transporting ATPase
LGPLQLLWINFAVDIPIAVALGFDTPASGLMSRTPRRINAPVLSREQWIRLTVSGLIMAGGSLIIRAFGDNHYDEVVGATMLMATFSFYHIIAALSVRDEYGTILSRDSLPAWSQLRLYGLSLLLAILVTELGLLQRIFDTTSLAGNQWLTCLGMSLSLLVFEELVKLVLRKRRHVIPATAVGAQTLVR